MGRWRRDGYILQHKECVSLRAKCDRMVSDAFSTAVNGNPEIDFQTKNESRRRSGRPQDEDVVGDEATCTKMILPTMAETCLEGVDHGLGFLRQRLFFHKGVTIDSEMADQVCLDHACGSDKCLAVKQKKGFHNRGVVWNSCMAKLAGEGKDPVPEMTIDPPTKDEVIVAQLEMTRRLAQLFLKQSQAYPAKTRRMG